MGKFVVTSGKHRVDGKVYRAGDTIELAGIPKGLEDRFRPLTIEVRVDEAEAAAAAAKDAEAAKAAEEAAAKAAAEEAQKAQAQQQQK